MKRKKNQKDMWSREAQLSKGAFQINFWRKKSEDWGCDKILTFFSTKKFTKHKTISQCFFTPIQSNS